MRYQRPSWLSITVLLSLSIVLALSSFLSFSAGRERFKQHFTDDALWRSGKSSYTAAPGLLGEGYALYAVATLCAFTAIACVVVALIRLGRAARV